MFCTKCGNQLADDARFCTKCGNQVGAAPAAAAAPGLVRLYMDAKGLTLMNYKFEIRDHLGYLRYRAATVTESMVRYNARLYYPNDTEAMAIHQQKKMTMVAMNFDIVTPNGALVTEAIQEVKMTSFTYHLPQLGIRLDGDFFALNFMFYRNGQAIGRLSKKLMAWGDCYELEFNDPSLEQVLLSSIMVIQMVIAAHRHRRR